MLKNYSFSVAVDLIISTRMAYPLTKSWYHHARLYAGLNLHAKIVSARPVFYSARSFQQASANPTSSISKFYQDSNVFVTGVTGFVGKALLEKLLRSCSGIANIYVLIRSKKGMGVQQRMDMLLESPVLNETKASNPKAIAKVRGIIGDVVLPNLGISESDRRLLESNVNVVFHSAATIRVNGSIKEAVELNTYGTQQIVQLCKAMKNLQSLVYVSTAYSNSNRNHAEEMIYEPPYDPGNLINCLKLLPEDVTGLISDNLIGDYANTYTFSKALAEKLIEDSSSSIPVTIVRPSMVTPSWKEPVPGWIEGFTNLTAGMLACAQGVIKTERFEKELPVGLVPIDIVVNTLIAAGWYEAIFRPSKLKLYNCTSWEINPITWGMLFGYIIKYARKYPTQHVVSYPSLKPTLNRSLHRIKVMLFLYAPAYLSDFYLLWLGKKPKNVRHCKKLYESWHEGDFMVLHSRTFGATAFKELVQAVKKAEDGKNFDIDMSVDNGFDWDNYLRDCHLGMRQFILKDDISSLPKARKKLNRLYWTKKAVQVMSVGALTGLFMTFSSSK